MSTVSGEKASGGTLWGSGTLAFLQGGTVSLHPRHVLPWLLIASFTAQRGPLFPQIRPTKTTNLSDSHMLTSLYTHPERLGR